MTAISVELILRRNRFQKDERKGLECLEKITHIRLDRENIVQIDHLEILPLSVTYLYLQHNNIELIENLESLQQLTFLTLAHNKIRRIENLLCLPKLKFLDVSENYIGSVDCDELPKSLIILSLKSNPCCNHDKQYREKILSSLPKLQQLDGEDLEDDEEESDTEDDEDGEQEKHDLGAVPRSAGLLSSTLSEDLVSNTSVHKTALELMDRMNDRMALIDKEYEVHQNDLSSLRENTNSSIGCSRDGTMGKYMVKARFEDENRQLLLTGMNQFREDGVFCDLTIKSRSNSFQVHRVVMCSQSAFIAAACQMRERENEEMCVSLGQFSDEIVLFVIRVCYASVDAWKWLQEHDNSVWKVVKAANFMQLLPLLELCGHFLEHQIGALALLPCYEKILAYNMNGLALTLDDFLVNYGEDVLRQHSTKLVHFPLHRLRQVLDSDQLNLPQNEDTLWCALKPALWSSHHSPVDAVLEGLLPIIRFGLLQDNHFLEFEKFILLEASAVTYLQLPEDVVLWRNALQRMWHDVVEMRGAKFSRMQVEEGVQSGEENTHEGESPCSSQLGLEPPFRIGRAAFSPRRRDLVMCHVHRDSLFVYSLFEDGGLSITLPEALRDGAVRYSRAVCCHPAGYLFILGQSRDYSLDMFHQAPVFYLWDLVRNRHHPLPPPPLTLLTDFAILCCGNDVYILGGRRLVPHSGDYLASRDILRFSVATQSWQIFPAKLPRPVYNLAACAVGYYIFITGGRGGGPNEGEGEAELGDTSSQAMCLDTRTMETRTLKNMPQPRSHHLLLSSSAHLEDPNLTLYVVDGLRPQERRCVLMYKVAENTWEQETTVVCLMSHYMHGRFFIHNSQLHMVRGPKSQPPHRAAPFHPPPHEALNSSSSSSTAVSTQSGSTPATCSLLTAPRSDAVVMSLDLVTKTLTQVANFTSFQFSAHDRDMMVAPIVYLPLSFSYLSPLCYFASSSLNPS